MDKLERICKVWSEMDSVAQFAAIMFGLVLVLVITLGIGAHGSW